MRMTGYAVNSSHADAWFPAIGKLLMNFGSLELMSHAWVHGLNTDATLTDVALDLPLGRRIQIIRMLLKRRPLSAALHERVLRAWASVEDISRLRNDIAHNPIIFGWNDANEEKPPDYIGVFSVRKLPKAVSLPLTTLAELNAAVDEAAKLAQELAEMGDEAAKELGKQENTGA